VHQQSESGVLVLVIDSCASTLQVDIREFHAVGEGHKLKRGVTGTGAMRDSSPYHRASTRSSSSAQRGFIIDFNGTD